MDEDFDVFLACLIWLAPPITLCFFFKISYLQTKSLTTGSDLPIGEVLHVPHKYPSRVATLHFLNFKIKCSAKIEVSFMFSPPFDPPLHIGPHSLLLWAIPGNMPLLVFLRVQSGQCVLRVKHHLDCGCNHLKKQICVAWGLLKAVKWAFKNVYSHLLSSQFIRVNGGEIIGVAQGKNIQSYLRVKGARGCPRVPSPGTNRPG